MFADWSAECSSDDPVLVVPWSAADGIAADEAEADGLEVEAVAEAVPDARVALATGPHFVDLRTHPYDFDQIAEADLYPPLLHALRALNAQRSPVFTAKCDAWVMEEEELEALRFQLDMPESEAPAGFSSYIDLLWRERSVFASLHQHEQILHRLSRHAEPLDHPLAALDLVLRPAMVDLEGPQEGFAISVYIKALGHDQAAAEQAWAGALDAVVAVLRSKDLTRA